MNALRSLAAGLSLMAGGAIATTPAPALAQAGGPYAPLVLMLPAGARTLAMGNTGVASRDDDVLFFNPAQLVVARGISASAERYSSTSGGGTLSSVTRFNNGGVAIGMRVVDYDAPTDAFPLDRETMLPSGPATGTSLEASVGLAQTFKGFRVGAAGKYVEDNVPSTRMSRAAFDAGVSKDFFQSYTVGLAVQNVGAGTSVPCSIVTRARPMDCLIPPGIPINPLAPVHLPLRTTLGVQTGKPVGAFDLVATAAVSMLRANWVSPSGGAELGYSWLDGYSIALRAGARRPLPGEAAITAGAGFTVDRLSIDYALETLSDSRVAHRIGLRIR